MAKLHLTPRINRENGDQWWFVEWYIGLVDDPGSEINLLDVIYNKLKYDDVTGFCVKDQRESFSGQFGIDARWHQQANNKFHVEFLSLDTIWRKDIAEHGEYMQRHRPVVGMVFKTKEIAEQFMEQVGAHYTFKALKKEFN